MDYELADSFRVEYPKHIINLLSLDNGVIYDDPEYKDTSHMLLITDVEKLTGYWICPKCNNHCILKSSQFKRDIAFHEKTCTGDKGSLVIKI
ncbi:hypothetical protein TRFO_30361 [Tritrichomonas foetus]|uniref:Uncharacterized protein n=1 Tax=Tritrichomonas foetus TaxID=1144522 RepID=A0A1J4JY90_9EUKA|nr:hypothetical protein TRFO_30361 [Tritrichomonas foetus]|eukprot:OHT02478.1 hypothetical protein TRFO_30361 [Tritrichomonas foetus]